MRATVSSMRATTAVSAVSALRAALRAAVRAAAVLTLHCAAVGHR
jgi:hypothetical protein